MISVVIPLYNKEKQIRATLESVLAQTFSDFEIVIVNDGSSDRSVEETSAVNDPRIRLIHQPNTGVSAARNRGIEEAKGEYIAFLDADDQWKPEYLQTQYELTQLYLECAVFVCNYGLVDAQGQMKPAIIRKLPFDGEHGVLINYFEVASCSHPPICSISIMVRRSAILSIGGFPLGIKSGEDLLTWARLACQYKIAYSKKVMSLFLMEGYAKKERPKREPDLQNQVGVALKSLYQTHKTPYLQHYISLWYRMRASIWMRLGRPFLCTKDAFAALKYNPLNYKALAIIIIAWIPSRIRMLLLRRI